MSASEPDLAFARFVRSGDARALAEVYDALAPGLYKVALRLARDAAEAEDLLQATFVTAIERRESFRAGERVEPWLAGVLANHARNLGRRARAPDAERIEHRVPETPIEGAARAELDEALERALETLPEAFRPVLVLRLEHGLSAAEIAAALGRAPGTVRSQLARGLEQVRRALPAGLAGAFAALCARPARGLDAVREALLAEAAARASIGVGAAGSIAAGAFWAKKIAVLVAVLLAGLVGWQLWRDAPLPARAAELEHAPALVAASAQEELRSALEDGPQARLAAASLAPSVAPPAAPASTGGELVVRVVDADDRPLGPGMAVIVRPAGSSSAFFDEIEVATDEQGIARFGDLPSGPIVVRGAFGGDARGEIRAANTLDLELVVPSGVRVVGEVVDESGLPVARARVWCSDPMQPWKGHTAAVADGQGRFVLASVVEGRFLAAKAPHHALSILHRVRGAPGSQQTVRIVLDREGASASGTVFDPEGRPIAGAHVLAGIEQRGFDQVLADGGSTPSDAPQRARTGSDGRFSLDGVPLGRLPVQARAHGFASSIEWREIAAPDNRWTIVLEHEAIVAGVVRDELGAALEGVELRAGPIATDASIPERMRAGHRPPVGDPTRFATSSARSGPGGRYELRGLPAGEIALVAEAGGPRRARSTLALAAGETHAWDPVLESVPRITGRVVDDRGAPFARASVVLVEERRRGVEDHVVSTDGDGVFEAKVEDAIEYRLDLYPSGRFDAFPSILATGVLASNTRLELVAPDETATGAIEGRVLGPEGAPAEDVEVNFDQESTRIWRQLRPEPATGRFAIGNVPPGSVRIELRSKAHPWKQLGLHAIHAGETLDLGDLRLASGARLRAELRGASDERLAGLGFFIGSPGGVATTGERAGRTFVSSALEPGRYSLWLYGPGIADVRLAFTIEAGRDTELAVDLVEVGTLEVVVRFPEPLAVPSSVSCMLLGKATQPVCLRSTETNGKREVSLLLSFPLGEWRLVADAGDGRRREMSVSRSVTGSASGKEMGGTLSIDL